MSPRGPGPRPVALLLHGIPGIEKNYDLAHMLRENGWVSVLFHYRGCWGSQGVYGLDTIPVDVKAAIDHVESGRYPQVDCRKIFLVGHSLGGWAAVLAGAVDERVRGVAVYGAVADPRALRWSQTTLRKEFIPWLNGISAYELGRQWAALGEELIPVAQVSKVSPRPLLILHGARDEEMPVAQAHALYERAQDPRAMEIHPQAGHTFEWERAWLRRRLMGWLMEHG